MNLYAQYEALRGWAGVKLKGLTMYVELVDSCPYACKTCPVGIDPRRDGNRMPIETFRQILDKAQSEVKVRKVQLYRWSDPLMHKDLHLFIEECNKRGIRCSTSSIMQYSLCDFGKVFAARPAEFRVSYSGRNMAMYQKNSDHDRFLEKLDEVYTKYPRYPETKHVMFFHVYKNNGEDYEPAKRLAQKYGLEFEAFPATLMVYDHIIHGSYTEEDRETLSWLTETPEENIARQKRKHLEDDYCNMQSKEIALDTRGDMQQCQLLFRREYTIGNFLTTPLKDLRRKVMSHPICKACKSKGVGHYSLIFADPAVEEKAVEAANRGKYAPAFPDFDR
jgi:hypothetical protein